MIRVMAIDFTLPDGRWVKVRVPVTGSLSSVILGDPKVSLDNDDYPPAQPSATLTIEESYPLSRESVDA